jgi:hypothetical protein
MIHLQDWLRAVYQSEIPPPACKLPIAAQGAKIHHHPHK